MGFWSPVSPIKGGGGNRKETSLSNSPNTAETLKKDALYFGRPTTEGAIFLWIRASWRLPVTSETVSAALHLYRTTHGKQQGLWCSRYKALASTAVSIDRASGGVVSSCIRAVDHVSVTHRSALRFVGLNLNEVARMMCAFQANLP